MRARPRRGAACAAAALSLFLLQGAARTDAAAGAGRHVHLAEVAGSCLTSADVSFLVCPPGGSGTGSIGPNLEAARYGGGCRARILLATQVGLVQARLEDGRPFPGGCGVVVRGELAKGSTVSFAFSPSRGREPGIAVWRLPRGASVLEVVAAGGAASAILTVDRRRLKPAAQIAPARPARSARLASTYRADMRRLEAIARGHVKGACAFYARPPGSRATPSQDRGCALTLGLAGRAAEIQASVSAVSFEIYNGYVVARSRLEGVPLFFVLVAGHFRFPTWSVLQ